MAEFAVLVTLRVRISGFKSVRANQPLVGFRWGRLLRFFENYIQGKDPGIGLRGSPEALAGLE